MPLVPDHKVLAMETRDHMEVQDNKDRVPSLQVDAALAVVLSDLVEVAAIYQVHRFNGNPLAIH